MKETKVGKRKQRKTSLGAPGPTRQDGSQRQQRKCHQNTKRTVTSLAAKIKAFSVCAQAKKDKNDSTAKTLNKAVDEHEKA